MPCYVLGLGANIDNPEQQIRRAFRSIQSHQHMTIVASSSLHNSQALTHKDNPQEQPDYINMVVAIDCNWYPEQLLNWIHYIEAKHGRKRTAIWQARPLDIDVLLCNDSHYTSNRLTIPHPEIHNRSFVVLPLQEISHQLPPAVQQCAQRVSSKNV